ncbi:sensor domain-containing phosphodiesterase [Jatrophihabitans endophyticus]|nr:EAL domain-containing protein [Jatrophihabitans endophyticus]
MLRSQVAHLLDAGAVRTHFQPIVDLYDDRVVAYEALSRGPDGPFAAPQPLFAAARAGGLLAEVDDLCRRNAVSAAVEAGMAGPLTLFVNVEPDVVDSERFDDFASLAERVPGRLRLVLEVTERALAARPAELLAAVGELRRKGWRIALDDVGADDLSLAFMPLLRPDVVKLDLRLVQQRPGPAAAHIMTATNAYTEQTGAVLLAEGIETARHLTIARALGARFGQGFLFGRAAPELTRKRRTGSLQLHVAAPPSPPASPFDCIPPEAAMRVSPKSLLVEISKHLEREAAALGPSAIIASTLQEARHFSEITRARYTELADKLGFVALIGEGLGSEPVAGVRGANLDPADPVRQEWDVVVLAPHFAGALLARDLGDTGPDASRRFRFALTYRRDAVVAAMHVLLDRVAPAPS